MEASMHHIAKSFLFFFWPVYEILVLIAYAQVSTKCTFWRTVNSEIFARVLFSRIFAYAKFRENKILAKSSGEMAKSLCHLLMKVNHVLVANIYVANMSLNAINENKKNLQKFANQYNMCYFLWLLIKVFTSKTKNGKSGKLYFFFRNLSYSRLKPHMHHIAKSFEI